MHPVKFSRWCPLFPHRRHASMFVRSRERGGGGGIASRGLQLDRPAWSFARHSSFHRCLRAPHLYTGVLPRRADGVQGWRVVDLDAARRRRAASSGDGRLPAAAAAPDAARSAQPSITPPAARRTVRVDLYVESTTPTTSRDTSKSPNSPPRECLRLGKLYIQGLAIWTR